MPNTPAPNAAAHNAEVAQRLAAQDLSGKSTASNDLDTRVAVDALDNLAKEVEAKNIAPPVDEAKAAEEAKAVEAAAKAAEEKAAAEAKIREEADKYFKDSPGLPSGASPKSVDSFNAVKVKAAQEISAREAELEKLRKELGEIKAKGPGPEQLQKEKELEDLKAWRASLDVDFDPKFREFDVKANQNREFIYAQLKKSPAVSDAVIDQIKKLGGPENVNLTKLFESINDPTLQRIVESKVADIEQVKYNKEQAVKVSKENLGQYLTKRQQETQQEALARVATATQEAEKFLTALEWFKDKTVDEKADAATKAAAEDHNKFLAELRGQVQESLRDDSPQMRAVLVTGVAQLFYLQRQTAAIKAENETLKKTVADLEAKYERVKSAGISRIRESAAPASGNLPPGKENLIRPTGDALDALAKQVMEERQAKGGG